jgi:hypothetical protein
VVARNENLNALRVLVDGRRTRDEDRGSSERARLR